MFLKRLSRIVPRPASRVPAPPRLEALEDRFMPAVNVFLSGRTLVAQGDARGNVIQFDNAGSNSVLAGVTVNNSLFDAVAILSGDGNDDVRINGATKPISIFLNKGNDTVNIGQAVVVLDLRAPVSINGSGGGLKTLFYNDQANPTPTLTYTLSAGRIQRNGLADVTCTGFTDVTVNTAAAGNQVVNVLSTSFPQTTTVRGGRGNDSFFVGDSSNRLQTLGRLVIDGGAGQNSLVIRDQGTTVSATYEITSTSVSRALGGAQPIAYSNLAALSVSGGSAGNLFFVGSIAADTSTSVAPGAGNNTILVGGGQVFARGDLTVTGGGGTDQLIINDRASPTPHNYSLTGSKFVRDGLATIRFKGVESVNLRAGGAFDGSVSLTQPETGGNNTITVSGMGAVSGRVNAGPGDAVTVLGFPAAPLTVSDPLGSASLVVKDGFLGGSQSYTVADATLARAGAAPISYIGMGSVRLITSGAVDEVFLNSTSVATTVVTGAGSTFRVGNVPFRGALTLSGGGGGKLDYSGFLTNVYVNLQTGEATNLKAFSGIRDVTGGNGKNILVGDGQGNVLVGGFGRNLLIAGDGSGAATLTGKSDEDILIGGFTAYDGDKAALDAIMAAWSSNSGFYADRVRQLTTGAGAPLLNATTVFGNQAADTLTGDAGFDLFFATEGMDRTDADAEAEVTVALPLGGLSGSVYLDSNNNGRRDPGEEGIAGVIVQLFRQTREGDVLVGTQATGEDGRFSFNNWPAGTYKLVEVQPGGYKDGKDRVGTLGERRGNDVIRDIVIRPGELGTDYEFGERRRR